MITLADFSNPEQTLSLPPNTPVRTRPPSGEDRENWSRLVSSAWIQNLRPRTVHVSQSDGDEIGKLRFEPIARAFQIETGAAWIWDTNEAAKLQAEILTFIADSLESSVPVLPPHIKTRNSVIPTLDWRPGSLDQNTDLTRSLNLARMAGLRKVMAEFETTQTDQPLRLENPTIARLRQGLATLPNPSRATVDIKIDHSLQRLHLHWAQKSDCDIIWGARVLTLSEKDHRIITQRLDDDAAQAKRDLAARVMAHAMAHSFAQTFGGAAMDVIFTFAADYRHLQCEAELHVGPSDWGFQLARTTMDLI
ncbi:hypothetical protein [Allosediminivita pacifica]|uniref:Uncharacterized protein n=1 Tax=Allosediminivita pacifica TaxID=1267769 RepID=A0A2T6A5C1_9RHOB|nr:hypothetical protein [Allosediminivita pacifica]PTX39020.1 hypothetical protein C8N44_14013 [Allosediminivita pacifica]GGB28406.1 hypothetical protein GCM10011324_42630 [Allosediminivita pacifica]